jgi:hypothetical protein
MAGATGGYASKLLHQPPYLRDGQELAGAHHVHRLILLPIEVSLAGSSRLRYGVRRTDTVAPKKLLRGLEALDQAWARARANVEQQQSEIATRGTTAWQQPQVAAKTGA